MGELKTSNYFYSILFSLFLASVFLLPSFQLSESLPYTHGVDLLLPLCFLALILNAPLKSFVFFNPFIYSVIGLLCVAILSIIVNSRISILRDDFELVKMLKFLIIVFFVSALVRKVDYMKILKIVFILVLLFNLLHYIDFMHFNQLIEKYYGSEVQVNTFGLNSLGQPDTKRILGTMGNPNNNAILFLFFIVLFFPENKSTFAEKIFFLLAVFGMFACQSRTGFIAFGVVFILGVIVKSFSMRSVLFYVLCFVLMYILLMLFGNIYLNSLSGNVMKQNSLRSRFETWSMLWEMIKQKPLLGYSPYKDYFYDNNIYAESEYFLYAWRYGFVGLFAYLAVLLSGLYQSFKMRFTANGFRFCMFTIVIAIAALTNTPLSDAAIYMMYAFVVGLFFSDKIAKEVVTA